MIEQTSWFRLQPLYKYIRQQSENRRFLKYAEIASTFFLIAIFLFFAIMPTASAISSLIGEIKSKETLSTAMSAKINSVMKAQDSFSQIQEDYSVLESSYPTSPNFNQSVSTVSFISKETTTPIKQIGFILDDLKSIPNNTNIFGLSFTTVGSYTPIISSIEKLSNSRRLMDIKNISITQVTKDGSYSNNQLNLNINADLYYLPQK